MARKTKSAVKQTQLKLGLAMSPPAKPAAVGKTELPIPKGRSRARNGKLECGKYIITPETKEISDTELRYLVTRPIECTIGEKPGGGEKDSASVRRKIRAYEFKRYRELKRWAKILERFNYQYIIILYMDNGFWAAHGHSALILNYKICARTAWQPRLQHDSDSFSKMAEGKVKIKAIDALRDLLEKSHYIEKKIFDSDELMVYKLKNKITRSEYEGFFEQREAMMQAIDSAVENVRTMPRLKMQLIETHELAFHYMGHPSAVKNSAMVTRRLVYFLDEAIRELYVVLKTERDVMDGLERIETNIISAQAELALIGQLRIWSEKEIADIGFKLANCTKYLIIERRRAEQECDGEEERIKSGVAQKNE